MPNGVLVSPDLKGLPVRSPRTILGLASAGLPVVMIALLPGDVRWGGLAGLAVAAAMLPLVRRRVAEDRERNREERREERISSNSCAHCGYSLRGLRLRVVNGRVVRTTGNCPECGTPYS